MTTDDPTTAVTADPAPGAPDATAPSLARFLADRSEAAFAAIVEVLKGWLGVKRSQVELLSGRANRNKVFLVRGLSVEQLRAVNMKTG